MPISMKLDLSRAIADARQFPEGTLFSWAHLPDAHSVFTDVLEPSQVWRPSVGAQLGVHCRLAPLISPSAAGERRTGATEPALGCASSPWSRPLLLQPQSEGLRVWSWLLSSPSFPLKAVPFLSWVQEWSMVGEGEEWSLKNETAGPLPQFVTCLHSW